MKIKSPNGTGNISKLPGNRRNPFRVRKTIGWCDGKQLYETVGYYPTKQDAIDALNEWNSGFDGSNVYFISNGKFVKIGKANDVHIRLKALQTASPVPLKILKIICCKSSKEAFELEKFLHLSFQDHHVMNEWFDIKPLVEGRGDEVVK